ncbi:MAG TPA: sugar-binding protein [Aggregatilinea sp.]|uniref:sugar-binding protein n=1 Tax=Aggregatilinea sp. TaxID=2806333 RepID=UPI002C61A552|nr:sugar-binding protein [Aggregatilinea sp.]HML22376.1 sugar-binding protein [Aggregatilinea sp.]
MANGRFMVLLRLLLVAVFGCGLLLKGRAPVERAQAQDGAMRDGIVNLEHLRFLTEPVTFGDRDVALVHIYSETPDYEWVDAAGEGIAAVDDVARAAIVYLWYYERTGDARALDEARLCLEFVQALQTDDGAFYNFVYDREGTINTEGGTSYKSLGWWAMRGLWALAEGYRVFSAVDPAYAAELQESYLLTESALAEMIVEEGATTMLHGYAIPSWIPGGATDVASVELLALTAYYRAAPNPGTQVLIENVASGIAAYGLGDSQTYPFGLIPVTTSAPGYWHAWGSHMIAALAGAGDALGRQDWIDVAARSADTFLVRQLAFERIREIGILPNRLGQIAYGTNMMVQDFMTLYRATGDPQYAQFAGLSASWFFGNNMAGVPMYDPDTGRGYDGINGPTVWRVNFNAGAESTIEALMALLTVGGDPAAARYMDYTETSVRPYKVVEAESGQVAGGAPDFRTREWTGEAVVSSGGYYSLGEGDALEVPFELAWSGDYWIYAAHQRQGIAVEETTLAALRTPGPVTVDGALDEWDAAPVFAANTGRQFLRGAGLWRGPDVDSFTIRFMWDDEALYLAAEVRDPRFEQDQVGPGVWQQDAFWGYLDATGRGTRLSAKFTLAQTPDGPQVWDWIAQTWLPNADLAWQAAPDGAGYTYEARLPFRSLRVDDPASGKVLGVEAGIGVGGDSFLDLTGADPDTPANLAHLILADDLGDLDEFGGAEEILSGADSAIALGISLDGEEPLVVPSNTSPDRRYLWLDRAGSEPVHLDAGAHTLRLTYAGTEASRREEVDGFLIQPVVAERVFAGPDGGTLTLTYDTRTGELRVLESE